MKKAQIGRAFAAAFAIAAFIAVLTWFFFSIHLLNQSYRNVIRLDEGWDITIDGETYADQNLNLFTFASPTKYGEPVVLQGTLPEELPEVATLRLLIYLSTVEVEIDGESVYSYGLNLAEQGNFVGSGYHFVLLPEDAAGKEAVVTITAYSNGAMSNVPPFEVIPTTYVYEEFYDENIVPICCCIFLFTFGIILIVLGLLALIRENAFAPIVHIGVFSLLIGYWALCNTKIIEMYSVDLSLNTTTEYMALYFAMCPLLLLIIALRGNAARWKKVLLWVQLVIITVFAVVTTVLHMTRLLYYPESITLFHVLAILEALGMLFTGIQTGGGRTASEKVLNAALFEILIVGILDVLRFNLQKYIFPDASHLDASFLPFGVLVFIQLLIISYVVQFYSNTIDAVEKETLTRLAYKDTLTDLYNRSMSEKLFAECDAGKEEYTLINLDLNGLKKVNDGFGHAQGDQLIRDFAGILKKAYDGVGTIARMGGDEFVVVIRDVPKNTIHQAVDKMVREEEKQSWLRDYEISSSYGIASRSELPEGDAEQVYKLADERMYEMKVRTKKARTD